MKKLTYICIAIFLSLTILASSDVWAQDAIGPVIQIDLNGADLELMNQDVHKGMIVDRWILVDVILPDPVTSVSWDLYFGDNLQTKYETTVKEKQGDFIYRTYIALPVVKVEPINLIMNMETGVGFLQNFDLTSQMFTILEDPKIIQYGPLTRARPFEDSIIIPINQRNDIYLKIVGEVATIEASEINTPETVSPDEFEPASK